MFKTYGLTHISLSVKNLQCSIDFYQTVFGVKIMYRKEGLAQVQTPFSMDIIVFEENEELAGKKGGIIHFGFRLTDPMDINKVRVAVEKAGGKIKDQGEFVPGEPYIFFDDPDGYEIEVWYELDSE